MARMINNKFSCVSAVENQCLGKLEHDLKHDKRWKERIKHEEAKRQGKGQAVGRPTEVFYG